MSDEVMEKCATSTSGCAVSKKIIDALVDQPLLGSIFIIDFAVLSLHKPPFLFSLLMLGGLAAMCMYYGQKLALFQIKPAEKTEPAVQAE